MCMKKWWRIGAFILGSLLIASFPLYAQIRGILSPITNVWSAILVATLMRFNRRTPSTRRIHHLPGENRKWGIHPMGIARINSINADYNSFMPDVTMMRFRRFRCFCKCIRSQV